MKKKWLWLATSLLAVGLLAGCGQKASNGSSSADTSNSSAASTVAGKSDKAKTIKVGASPSPHAEILEEAKKVLAEKGYNLEIVQYTDYVQPNKALESKEIDANYFQHKPYLDEFNQKYGTHLVAAGTVHYEPFGIYAGKTKTLDALKDGAKIAVPNDVTNEARALLLLQAQGLIKLKDGAGLTATKQDIVENKKNLDLYEVEAAQLPRSLQDVDVAVINGNYAIEAGLKVSDALATEKADSEAAITYANIIAVREGDEKSEATNALLDAVRSDDVKKFIETKYNGSVVPMF